MRQIHGWLIGAMLLCASTAPAAAQANAPAREGFYISAWLGNGWETASCSGCGSSSESARSGYLALRGTIDPQWRVGIESQAWSKSQSGSGVQALTASHQSSVISHQ